MITNGLRNLLADKLIDNKCEINEIETESRSYGPTTLKCKLEMKLLSDSERFQLARIERMFGLNPYVDTDAVKYCRSDLEFLRDAWPRRIGSHPFGYGKIEKVIFNNPATIVIWRDGSKTVVKCEEEEFDPEKGLAMAIAKHFLGTNKTKSDYYNVFEKWLPKEEMTDEEKKLGNTILESTYVNPFEESIVINEKIMDDITSRIMDSLKKSDKDTDINL